MNFHAHGFEQLDQILNRNSQDGEQEGISFASSLLEDGRDSAGRGLEKEEGSENEMGDSGVVFPFLDHSPQQENRADVEFGGGDKAELEKVKLSAMNKMNTMKMLRQPLFPFLQPGGEPERRGQFWNWEGGRGKRVVHAMRRRGPQDAPNDVVSRAQEAVQAGAPGT